MTNIMYQLYNLMLFKLFIATTEEYVILNILLSSVISYQ